MLNKNKKFSLSQTDKFHEFEIHKILSLQENFNVINFKFMFFKFK